MHYVWTFPSARYDFAPLSGLLPDTKCKDRGVKMLAPNREKAADVKLKNITKHYGDVIALEKVNLDIKAGEFFTLLGPSGCGKTTLLRIVAGLGKQDEGDVFIRGKKVNDIPPWERNTALVFQSYAIWPFMNVFDNIAYALKLRKVPKEQIKKKVKSVMNMLGLDGLEKRRPDQLSGGQLQRVALARTLVIEPPVLVLILDEPLSNLDAKIRVEVREEIRRLQSMLGITTLYVTHDQEEALVISDRIAVLNNGRVEQIGTPVEIYSDPQTPFVASFIGAMDSMKGNVSSKKANIATIRISEGLLIKGTADDEIKQGQDVTVFVRPENIKIQTATPHREAPGELRGDVSRVIFAGNMVRYKVKITRGEMLTVEAHHPVRSKMFEEGSHVILSIDPRDVLIFPR